MVPIVLRSLVSLTSGRGSFGGAITGGNGNGFPAREDTFAFDVPSGAPALDVKWTLASDPNTLVLATLTGPDGQALGQQIPVTSSTGVETMDIYHANPQPGRWVVTFATFNPVGGTTTAGAFTGMVSPKAPPISSSGVPDNASTVIPTGGSANGSVTITNNGNSPLLAFIDPRLSQEEIYTLQPITQASDVPLPFNVSTAPPEWIVPTQTDLVEAAAQGAPRSRSIGASATPTSSR